MVDFEGMIGSGKMVGASGEDLWSRYVVLITTTMKSGMNSSGLRSALTRFDNRQVCREGRQSWKCLGSLVAIRDECVGRRKGWGTGRPYV